MVDPVDRFVREASGVTAARKRDAGGPVHHFDGDLSPDDKGVRIFALAPDAADAAGDAFARTVAGWGNASGDDAIVSVLASGGEPRPWVAVERVDGRPLDEAQPDLSPTGVLDVVRHVADAIRTASLYNTRHLGLAPRHVWVTRDGDGVGAIVDDWGLHGAVRTAAGDPPVTPFTAPEQVDDPAVGDAATDVYRLGALAYYALTGRPPVETGGDAGRAVQAGDVTPPSAVDESLDPDVDDVVLSALATRPAARPSTAAEFGRRFAAAFDPADGEADADAAAGGAAGAAGAVADDATAAADAAADDGAADPAKAETADVDSTADEDAPGVRGGVLPFGRRHALALLAGGASVGLGLDWATGRGLPLEGSLSAGDAATTTSGEVAGGSASTGGTDGETAPANDGGGGTTTASDVGGHATTSHGGNGQTTSAEGSLDVTWDRTGTLNLGGAVIDDGTLFYVEARASVLRAAAPATGAVQWESEPVDSGGLGPVTVGESVVCTRRAGGTGTPALYVHDRSSGERRWQFSDPEASRRVADVATTPRYVVAVVGFGGKPRSIYVLDQTDGSVAWSLGPGSAWRVFSGRDRLYVCHESDSGDSVTDVYAIETGEQRERIPGLFALFRDGTLYGSDSKFEVATGERTRWDLSGGSRSNWALYGDRLLLSVNGTLTAVDTAAGTVEETYSHPADLRTTPVPTDSRFWVIDESGFLTGIGWDGTVQYRRSITPTRDPNVARVPSGLAATDDVVVFAERTESASNVLGATLDGH